MDMTKFSKEITNTVTSTGQRIRSTIPVLAVVLTLLVSAGAIGFTGTATAQESSTDYTSAPDNTSDVLANMTGSGTTDDPYVINDSHQLQAMNADVDANYVLGQNISASGTETWDSDSDGTSEGFKPVNFSGHLDGQGYEIKNLHIDRPNTDFVGLFGVLQGKTVEVGLIDPVVSGNSIVGTIAGELATSNGNATNVYVEGGNVTSNSPNDASYLGGLAGEVDGGTLYKSYSATTVNGDGDDYTGSLVGGALSGVVYDLYWNTNVTEQTTPVGANNAQSSNNLIGLTTDEMRGDSASSNMDRLDFNNTWYEYTNPVDYPKLQAQEIPTTTLEFGNVSNLTHDNLNNVNATISIYHSDGTQYGETQSTTNLTNTSVTIPSETGVEVEVDAEGYEHNTTITVDGTAADNMVRSIDLATYNTIDYTVTKNGSPVENATVYMYHYNDAEEFEYWYSDKTNESGVTNLTAAEGYQYRVIAVEENPPANVSTGYYDTVEELQNNTNITLDHQHYNTTFNVETTSGDPVENGKIVLEHEDAWDGEGLQIERSFENGTYDSWWADYHNLSIGVQADGYKNISQTDVNLTSDAVFNVTLAEENTSESSTISSDSIPTQTDDTTDDSTDNTTDDSTDDTQNSTVDNDGTSGSGSISDGFSPIYGVGIVLVALLGGFVLLARE